MRLVFNRGVNMTNEELVSLIQQGIDSSSNMELLYINNKSYIYHIAKKYNGYTDVEDLMQEAYFGLYEAVQRYENSHEVKFMTYAGYWIQQAIKRYVDNNSKEIRLPIGLQGKIYQYSKIVNTYESQLNRKPTNRELCYCLKMDFRALEHLKSTINRFNKIESLNNPLNGEESRMLSDTIPDDIDIENEVISRVMKENIKSELWDIVKENTTEEENRVIRERYINNLSLEGTGEILGKTGNMIRNIEAKGLRKLRRTSITRKMKEKFEVNIARAYRGSVSSFNYDWTSSTERVALKNLEIKGVL